MKYGLYLSKASVFITEVISDAKAKQAGQAEIDRFSIRFDLSIAEQKRFGSTDIDTSS